jgi:hypothetical protein
MVAKVGGDPLFVFVRTAHKKLNYLLNVTG